VRVLVTGGAGFIGANLVRHLLRERSGWRVVVVDALTYAGNLESLGEALAAPQVRFVHGDVRDGRLVRAVLADERVDAVLHLAAESHVDRSIAAPAVFVETNVGGTQVLLDAAREARVARFVHVSTDEVYGALGETGVFTEATPLAPTSPYAASKAAADLLALSWAKTWRLPVVVTRASNNLGPFQFPEKLVPLMVVKALRGEPLPVYGDGRNVRDWLHVEDHCAGLVAALERGRPGEVYNLGGGAERRNLHVVQRILELLGRPRSLVTFVADRPGHDFRYALDASKARADLGWAPRWSFDDALADTVAWYASNRGWWERILSGVYRMVDARTVAAGVGACGSR
jgi:dTDP-glucose 4,6-dehydratase